MVAGSHRETRKNLNDGEKLLFKPSMSLKQAAVSEKHANHISNKGRPPLAREKHANLISINAKDDMSSLETC